MRTFRGPWWEPYRDWPGRWAFRLEHPGRWRLMIACRLGMLLCCAACAASVGADLYLATRVLLAASLRSTGGP